MTTPNSDRLQHIAAMYAKHHDQLRAVVRRQAPGAQHATIEDACSHAWSKLITADHVDVRPPRWGALAYLTKTAVYKASDLRAAERRAAAHDHDQLDYLAAARGVADAPADQGAALRMRCDLALDLVAQIPERPRRFLLRQALGYSYHEIAAAEGVSYRTTDRQMTRAKRYLEQIAAADGGEFRRGGD
jgi:DNA-directed RNA polymerase specialized sigma24 family protein